MHTVLAMTRDCPTSRMSRIDLHHLLDATAAPDRQMETIRMPKLQVQELNAVPEALAIADGTPPEPLDVSTEITRQLEAAIEPTLPPAIELDVRIGRGLGDVTLLAIICSFAFLVCLAIAGITAH